MVLFLYRFLALIYWLLKVERKLINVTINNGSILAMLYTS